MEVAVVVVAAVVVAEAALALTAAHVDDRDVKRAPSEVEDEHPLVAAAAEAVRERRRLRLPQQEHVVEPGEVTRRLRGRAL